MKRLLIATPKSETSKIMAMMSHPCKPNLGLSGVGVEAVLVWVVGGDATVVCPLPFNCAN